MELQNVDIVKAVNEVDFYSSMNLDKAENKALLFKAMTNPDKKISDMINMEINMRDIFVEIVEVRDENTGELNKAPRIVIIDTKGVSYSCVSQGIYNSLKRLMALFGQPTWENGLKIKIQQINKKQRNILTIALA